MNQPFDPAAIRPGAFVDPSSLALVALPSQTQRDGEAFLLVNTACAESVLEEAEFRLDAAAKLAHELACLTTTHACDNTLGAFATAFSLLTQDAHGLLEAAQRIYARPGRPSLQISPEIAEALFEGADLSRAECAAELDARGLVVMQQETEAKRRAKRPRDKDAGERRARRPDAAELAQGAETLEAVATELQAAAAQMRQAPQGTDA